MRDTLIRCALVLACMLGTHGVRSVSADEEVRVVARGLVNPRGVAVQPDGTLLVAQAGSKGPTASIVAIDTAGCPTPLLDGYSTERVVFSAPVGFADVAVLDGAVYALYAGGDIDRGLEDNGLYKLDGHGGATLVADISAFIKANPVAEKPGDYTNSGQPSNMVALPDHTGFVATEGNSNQLLRLGFDGTVTRIADLSKGHPIASGVANAPDGGWYVAYFTHAPYEEGSAKVVHVAPDGTVSDQWTGLTMAIDLAIDSAGVLYAAEMATGYGDDPSNLTPGSGEIVRQTGPGSAENVVEGLDLPVALTMTPAGSLLISSPSVGADGDEGLVLEIDLSGASSALPVRATEVGTPVADCG